MRDFRTFFQADQLARYQQGVMGYHYRDVMCNKSPIDLALYMRLIYTQKPRTIIEIGSKFGGSAMLFRDLTRIYGFDTQVVSIDRAPPEDGPDFEGIRFVKGNVLYLHRTFAEHGLYDLPRPWLVSEDSAHTHTACLAVLEFFAQHLRSGEYLIMEDGILQDLGLADKFEGGPSRALGEYLPAHPDIYEIDEFYCDMFGKNATTNPNGYLRRK